MGQVSRMAAEVNKLIGRSLLDGKAVHLPEVGSLYIVVNPEGVKSIDFSSSEQGASLIEVIKERAGCTPEQAVEIFNRWIAEVRTSTAIVVEGVGELRNKTFVTLESFATKLNPKPLKKEIPMAKETKKAAKPTEAKTPVPTPTPTPAPAPAKAAPKAAPKAEPAPKKSNNKAILICVFVVLAAIGGYIGFDYGQKAKAEKARIEAIAKEKAAEQQRIADSIAVARIEAKRLAAAEAATAAASVTPRFKVVYGVYELRSNVDVAIKVIDNAYGDDTAHEYPFAGLTLVSMFESDNRSECQKFLMENYDTYPDTWIYDAEQ